MLNGEPIIGAAGGLGLNFAHACVQAGANVAGVDISISPHRDFQTLGELGPKVKYYRCVTMPNVKYHIPRVAHSLC